MKTKKNQDLVSVIIPYYESKKFIKKSLMSAINQTYKKIQIIIIYDEINSFGFNMYLNCFRMI